jgi:hypothetical protein
MNIKKSKEDEGATVPERVFCKAIKPFVWTKFQFVE